MLDGTVGFWCIDGLSLEFEALTSIGSSAGQGRPPPEMAFIKWRSLVRLTKNQKWNERDLHLYAPGTKQSDQSKVNRGG